MSWFIIDQFGEPSQGDEILGFWFESGVPTIGVLMYGPVWFASDDNSNECGPDGWTFPGYFGLRRKDGSWEQKPDEVRPTHWIALPDPPVQVPPKPGRPTIEDVIAGRWP